MLESFYESAVNVVSVVTKDFHDSVIEIDECTRGIHNCRAGYNCVNTVGSFICSGKSKAITVYSLLSFELHGAMRRNRCDSNVNGPDLCTYVI